MDSSNSISKTSDSVNEEGGKFCEDRREENEDGLRTEVNEVSDDSNQVKLAFKQAKQTDTAEVTCGSKSSDERSVVD